MNKDDSGFTLIELIVTIVILVIISSGAVVGIRTVRYADTIRISKNINSVMDKIKLDNMTKDKKQYMFLYMLNDSLYLKAVNQEDVSLPDCNADTGKKLGESMKVFYKKPSDTDETELLNNNLICISFNRSTGAFTDDSYAEAYEYIKLINSGKTATIFCSKDTGRYYIK
jgi:prepilin-type N-terminal cleavage/methylation domain-containing protein